MNNLNTVLQTDNEKRTTHFIRLWRPIKIKIIIFILINLFASNFLFAQQIKVTNDFGVWGGINIEKKLLKDFEISLEQQIRLYSDATKFDDYIIDLGAKYKLNKNFKLGADIRYTYNSKRWKEAENEYRYNLDLRYKGSISKKASFHYRLRYQNEFVNLFSEYPKTNVQTSAVRNRLEVKYEIAKMHEGYFSAELFRTKEPFYEPYFNKVRFYIGDDINYNRGEFDIAFGFEQEINSTYPLSFFFFKTIYKLKL